MGRMSNEAGPRSTTMLGGSDQALEHITRPTQAQIDAAAAVIAAQPDGALLAQMIFGEKE